VGEKATLTLRLNVRGGNAYEKKVDISSPEMQSYKGYKVKNIALLQSL